MTRFPTGSLLLLVVPVLLGLVWWAWRGRARRQSSVAALPGVPTGFVADRLGPLDGTYVSTTSEGDRLDRVVVHGLGARSPVEVFAASTGLLLARRGAPDVWIPVAGLRRVRRERGMAGTHVEPEALVVLTWSHEGTGLDTGVRLRRADDAALLVEAVQDLSGVAR